MFIKIWNIIYLKHRMFVIETGCTSCSQHFAPLHCIDRFIYWACGLRGETINFITNQWILYSVVHAYNLRAAVDVIKMFSCWLRFYVEWKLHYIPNHDKDGTCLVYYQMLRFLSSRTANHNFLLENLPVMASSIKSYVIVTRTK